MNVSMPRKCASIRRSSGFTLLELILVIVILAVIAAIALPRFAALSSEARIASLESVAGTMKSTAAIVRSKAYLQGLSRAASNPGGTGSEQTGYVIETEAGSSEVDWRNLCPESQAELGDTLTMLDYISLDGSSLKTFVDNQFTRVGYNLPSEPGPGCYVEYDSFGDPDCTVTLDVSGC